MIIKKHKNVKLLFIISEVKFQVLKLIMLKSPEVIYIFFGGEGRRTGDEAPPSGEYFEVVDVPLLTQCKPYTNSSVSHFSLKFTVLLNSTYRCMGTVRMWDSPSRRFC